MKAWAGLLLMVGLAAAGAQDFLSEEFYEGVYWDSNNPGEGFTFDTQNGVGFMTIYTYDAQGEPTFFTAIGGIDTDAKGGELPVFDADVYRTRDFTDSQQVGELRIFDPHADLDRLTMEWDERQIELRRFVYAYNPGPLDRMGGTWLMAILNDDVAEGAGVFDLIAIEDLLMQDSRGSYLAGQTLALSSNPARIYHENGEFVAVIPVSDNSGETIVLSFQSSENVMSGLAFEGDADGMVISTDSATMLGFRLSFVNLLGDE